MAPILALALVALSSADELGLIQSKLQLADDLLQPQQSKAQGFSVELASFTASSLIMTVALLIFTLWAAREHSSMKKRPEETGETAVDPFLYFMQSVQLGDESVEQILQSEPDFAHRRDAWGASALHVAAGAGASVTLQLLLKADADVNARDGFEDTPLHLAAASGELCCLLALIGAGADINATNADDATPIQLAAKADQKVAWEMLLENDASWDDEICEGSEGLPLKAASMATVSTADDSDAISILSPACSPCSLAICPDLSEVLEDGSMEMDSDEVKED